jgi:uncharacterized OB-fold protein
VHPDFPLPDVDEPLSRPFWTAAARGELAIPRCNHCSRWVWYPAEQCRWCGSAGLEWTSTSGRGTLFTWTVVERVLLPQYVDLVPYVAALVALEEDPMVRIVTRMVGVSPAELVADMDVEVVFRPIWFGDPAKSVVAPLFMPAGMTGAEGRTSKLEAGQLA